MSGPLFLCSYRLVFNVFSFPQASEWSIILLIQLPRYHTNPFVCLQPFNQNFTVDFAEKPNAFPMKISCFKSSSTKYIKIIHEVSHVCGDFIGTFCGAGFITNFEVLTHYPYFLEIFCS